MHLTPAALTSCAPLCTRAEPCDWLAGAPMASQQCWGVTAGHNASSARCVTAGKMGCNSSNNNNNNTGYLLHAISPRRHLPQAVQ